MIAPPVSATPENRNRENLLMRLPTAIFGAIIRGHASCETDEFYTSPSLNDYSIKVNGLTHADWMTESLKLMR